MRFKLFVVFHNKIFPECYEEMNPEDRKSIILYGVKNKADTDLNIIYEFELKNYNDNFQKNLYNESSALYHIYVNELYNDCDYIGLFQYDTKFFNFTLPVCRFELENSDKENIFYYNFNPNIIPRGGQKGIVDNYYCFNSGLSTYNKFFKTDFTIDVCYKNKMIICNTFIVSVKIFKKLMSWLIYYYKNDMPDNLLDKFSNINFNPGHLIEGLTGMFMALEVEQGAVYQQLKINHDHKYKNMNYL